MSSLKYYIADWNGILADLKDKLTGHLANPRDADVWITWQDIRGSFGDLITTSKKYFPKPVYTVQHGRASTLDYGKPHNFPLNADRYLCWGKNDYNRMSALGYRDRTTIVGCPLNTHIKPLIPHKEKIVLFVPVNTGKEEPENIAVYYELMKIKYQQAGLKVIEFKDQLKDKWGFNNQPTVKFNELSINFDVVAKLLPWHDRSLYHGSVLSGYQDNPNNNNIVFNLLRNVDLVVGLDEGTTEMFAYGHNVPVIIVDGFQYRQYGPDGRKFSLVDTYRTKAAVHTDLDNLADCLADHLDNPSILESARKEVAEAELGLSAGNPADNIINVIKKDMKAFYATRS